MKKFTARTLLALILAVVGATAINAATTYNNVLCINRVDGVCEHLMLDTALDIQVTDDGGIRLIHPDVWVFYDANEVDYFTFASLDDPETYDGDHSAINELTAPDRTIKIADGTISVDGASSVSIYDLNGRQISRATIADNGSATLSISSLPSGIYIVRIDSTSLKIKL